MSQLPGSSLALSSRSYVTSRLDCDWAAAIAADARVVATSGNTPRRMSDVIAVPRADAGSSRGSKLRRMIEVFVVGLQETPMRDPEFLDAASRIPVRSEQNPVLILEEELANHARRSAE